MLTSIGLFSKAVWNFEMNAWSKLTGGDAAETGSGPGSYDIRQSVWHVSCCNPELNGGGGWVSKPKYGRHRAWTSNASHNFSDV